MDKEFLLSQKEKIEKEIAILKKELEDISHKEGNINKPNFPKYQNGFDAGLSGLETYEINLSLEENILKMIRLSEKALKKIEDGTYGVCENCQQQIPLDRLKIFPQADLCLSCRQKKT